MTGSVQSSACYHTSLMAASCSRHVYIMSFKCFIVVTYDLFQKFLKTFFKLGWQALLKSRDILNFEYYNVNSPL